MTVLKVKGLVKDFPDNRYPAVNQISFAMTRGEILTLVGPSGCGKTTTLRIIAGLEQPDQGEVWINQHKVAGGNTFIPPERRGVGMVFQDHALFPHLSVFNNIAFGLKGRKSTRVKATVTELLDMIGLESHARRFPHELSGGERQRVALARALAPQPVLVLMDEPFSSLDTDLRISMREQVRSLLKALNATVIFVTHDQEEALFMGDRVAVVHRGRLEQIDTPENIFQHPSSHFVAEFMGSSIFLPAVVAPGSLETELGRLDQPTDLPLGNKVEIAVRADDIDFDPDTPGNAVIIERIFRGILNLYRLQLDSGPTIEAIKGHTEIYPAGTRIKAYLNPGHPLTVFQSD